MYYSSLGNTVRDTGTYGRALRGGEPVGAWFRGGELGTMFWATSSR